MTRAGATRRRVVALVVVLAGSALPVLPALRASAATPTGDWHVAATLALGTDATAISCAATTRCWAIEAGQLLESRNAGRSWASETTHVPGDVVALHDLACGNVSTCLATATDTSGRAVVLEIGGSTVTETYVGGADPWNAISCPGVHHCLATDGAFVYTTADGAHWDAHALPQILHGGSFDLACVRNTRRCWTVGNNDETPIIERTTDNGATWHVQAAPASADGMYAVACPSETTCFAGGASFSDDAMILVTTDGGKRWDFAPVPFQPAPVRSIACVSTTACWASGQTPGNTAFMFATGDGAQWNAQALPVASTANPAAVSCPSTTQCAAIAGGIGFATVDAGAEWDAVPVPAAVEAPQSLACPSATECVAVENNAVGAAQSLTSPDGGTTWTAHGFPAGTGLLLAVECPSPTLCRALATVQASGSNHSVAQAYWSVDGGARWKAARVQSPGGVLQQMTCPSPSTCLALGYDNQSAAKIEKTTDGGRHWLAVTPPPAIFYMEGVACATVHACVVIAQKPGAAPLAFTTTDLGATYEPRPLPYTDAQNQHFSDVDCSGRACVAVGEDSGVGVIMRSKNAGSTWTASKVPNAAMSIGNLSCASATTCAAAAFDYRPAGGPLVLQSTDGGRTWAAVSVPARDEQPIDIACHGGGCIASDVGRSGNPIILAGTF